MEKLQFNGHYISETAVYVKMKDENEMCVC